METYKRRTGSFNINALNALNLSVASQREWTLIVFPFPYLLNPTGHLCHFVLISKIMHEFQLLICHRLSLCLNRLILWMLT